MTRRTTHRRPGTIAAPGEHDLMTAPPEVTAADPATAKPAAGALQRGFVARLRRVAGKVAGEDEASTAEPSGARASGASGTFGASGAFDESPRPSAGAKTPAPPAKSPPKPPAKFNLVIDEDWDEDEALFPEPVLDLTAPEDGPGDLPNPYARFLGPPPGPDLPNPYTRFLPQPEPPPAERPDPQPGSSLPFADADLAPDLSSPFERLVERAAAPPEPAVAERAPEPVARPAAPPPAAAAQPAIPKHEPEIEWTVEAVVKLPQRRPTALWLEAGLKLPSGAVIPGTTMVKASTPLDLLRRFDAQRLERAMAEREALQDRHPAEALWVPVLASTLERPEIAAKLAEHAERAKHHKACLRLVLPPQDLPFLLAGAAWRLLPNVEVGLMLDAADLPGSVELATARPAGVHVEVSDLIEEAGSSDGPMRALLEDYAARGGKVAVAGVEHEAWLREALDFPTHHGQGALFEAKTKSFTKMALVP